MNFIGIILILFVAGITVGIASSIIKTIKERKTNSNTPDDKK